MQIFDRILAARGLSKDSIAAFLNPNYSELCDPMLLPDMNKTLDRMMLALNNQEKIVIYGDYDIDGLTATALMYDAMTAFGYKNVTTFIPNRFVEGYGLNLDAIERIAEGGVSLIITVDCGSRSQKEIEYANEIGLDIIVTDHHEALEIQPPAIAVVNPKRIDSKYPFRELAGVGVAFKLIQAMQTRMLSLGNLNNNLSEGQEKWLLDLVALGTICDVVPLIKENRILAYFGLNVLQKTRRVGLRALFAVSKIDPSITINSKSVGFMLGPRMNAAGRLETAQHSLDMLLSDNKSTAMDYAGLLDDLNLSRRNEQSKIQKVAEVLAANDSSSVLVLSDPEWNHGVVGIVAARLLEKFKKPTFIFQEMGEESKGSARSFGDFNAAEALDYCRDLIIKGGGHKLAAGVTLKTENIPKFRQRINEYYQKNIINDQSHFLLPNADTTATFSELDEKLLSDIASMEPFGNSNPQPILKTEKAKVVNVRRMGSDAQHLRIDFEGLDKVKISMLSFNAPDYFFVDIGTVADIWYYIDVNEWQGRRTIEGKLIHIELS